MKKTLGGWLPSHGPPPARGLGRGTRACRECSIWEAPLLRGTKLGQPPRHWKAPWFIQPLTKQDSMGGSSHLKYQAECKWHPVGTEGILFLSRTHTLSGGRSQRGGKTQAPGLPCSSHEAELGN